MFCPKCTSNVSDNADAGVATTSPKPWMRVAACAVATIAAIAIALFSLSGCGGGGGDARSGSSASKSAASSSSEDVEPSVEDLIKPTVNDYTWGELSKISEEIAKASDESAAIEVAKKHNLTTKDGKLDGAQTKSVTLSNGVKTAVQIVGFAHDEKADGGKAGITFIFKDSIVTHNMNSTDSNAGGWEKSEMRSYLNSEGVNLLPSDLKQKVVSVKKLTNNVGVTESTSSVTSTSDRLWLFSYTELCGTINWTLGFNDAAHNGVFNAEGSQYKLFRDMSVKVHGPNSILAKNLDGESYSWWERSPCPGTLNGGDDFVCVKPNGVLSDSADYATYFYGVVPGFCI